MVCSRNFEIHLQFTEKSVNLTAKRLTDLSNFWNNNSSLPGTEAYILMVIELILFIIIRFKMDVIYIEIVTTKVDYLQFYNRHRWFFFTVLKF